MKQELLLKSISDDELLRRLSELLNHSRRVESELVAHIGEVDARRLYARTASSMFVYATKVLSLSEYEAYLRIGVARAARKHPILLEMLGDGRLYLSGIARLAPLLTEANRESVLDRAVGMSKREIEELVAELSPKEDIPATIRKLPERRQKTKPTPSATRSGTSRRLDSKLGRTADSTGSNSEQSGGGGASITVEVQNCLYRQH